MKSVKKVVGFFLLALMPAMGLSGNSFADDGTAAPMPVTETAVAVPTVPAGEISQDPVPPAPTNADPEAPSIEEMDSAPLAPAEESRKNEAEDSISQPKMSGENTVIIKEIKEGLSIYVYPEGTHPGKPVVIYSFIDGVMKATTGLYLDETGKGFKGTPTAVTPGVPYDESCQVAAITVDSNGVQIDVNLTSR